MSDAIIRTWWIDPPRLLGGPFPGARTEDRSLERLAHLLDVGVRAFVNLQEPDEVALDGRLFPPYRPLVERLAAERAADIAFAAFPIADMDVPSDATMQSILGAIEDFAAEGRVTYVHCWGGHGRTGTVAGCWLVRSGLSADAALDRIARQREHDPHLYSMASPQTAAQRAFISAWPRVARD